MGTRTYPDLHELLRPVGLDGAWRVYPARYLNQPLGTGPGYSRFAAPAGTYTVLYAAGHFETALREGLIRDRYDKRKQRRIAEHTLREHAAAQIRTKKDLQLVDLTDGNATDYGVPSAIRHGKDYARSQAFSSEIYTDMAEADGILFRSRLDDGVCVAVLGRAIAPKLEPIFRSVLPNNPLTRPTLSKLRMTTFRWQGRM